MKARFVAGASVSFASLTAVLAQSPFTAGDVAVLQVGDGSAALSPAAAPLFMDEFSVTPNTLIQQFAIRGLTLTGNGPNEGALALSQNGSFLTFAAYEASVGTPSVASSTALRTVGVVNSAGGFSVTAPLVGGAFSGNSVSSAVSDNQNFWVSGSGSTSGQGGLWYSTGSGVPVQVMSGSFATSRIFNGNLYLAANSGTPSLYEFSGLPTGAASPSLLFTDTVAGASPNDFAVSPDGKTVYIADDGGFLSRGIEKWQNVGGTWTYEGRMAVGNLAGALQLAVEWGPTPTIFATTSEISGDTNRLVEVVDNGTMATATTIDSSAANTLFGGISLVPIPLPEPGPIAILGLGLSVLWLRRKRAA